MKYLLIPVALLLGGRWIKNKMNLTETILWKIVDVSFKVGFPNSLMLIEIELQNISNSSLKVQSIEGSINVNNSYIGYASSLNEFEIPSNNTVTVEVGVNVTSLNLVSTLLNLFATKNVTLNFVGSIQILGIKLPIDYTYKYGN